LVLEGEKYNIRVNTLAPCAATRMTEELLSEQALELLEPSSVTPAVLYLVSPDGPTRTIMGAGAGNYSVIQITETAGKWLADDQRTPEAIAENWAAINNPDARLTLTSASAQTQNMLEQAARGLGIDLKLGGSIA
jgi:hypothetical protein